VSDGTDLMSLGTHGGVGALAAAITTAVSRIFAGKEAQAVTTKLAVIEEQLKNLTAAIEKHGELGERVALLEQSVKALHERFDGKRGPRR